jgi:hypothetical protein
MGPHTNGLHLHSALAGAGDGERARLGLEQQAAWFACLRFFRLLAAISALVHCPAAPALQEARVCNPCQEALGKMAQRVVDPAACVRALRTCIVGVRQYDLCGRKHRVFGKPARRRVMRSLRWRWRHLADGPVRDPHLGPVEHVATVGPLGRPGARRRAHRRLAPPILAPEHTSGSRRCFCSSLPFHVRLLTNSMECAR